MRHTLEEWAEIGLKGQQDKTPGVHEEADKQ
jgi:hypothetical protein